MKTTVCTLAAITLASALYLTTKTQLAATLTPRNPSMPEFHKSGPSHQSRFVFVPNTGQTDPRVRYSAQVGGATFHFNAGGAAFVFTKGKNGHAVHLSFPGSNSATEPSGTQRGNGIVNYLIGDDPWRWRTGLPTYGEIVYRDLWPGIDLVFRGDGRELKYEFLIAPGGDPKNIHVAYGGIRALSLEQNGDLRIHTSLGVLHDSAPVSYQDIDGKRLAVESAYQLDGKSYRFNIGPYDRSRPLIVDPGLDYSTYLGGSGNERAWDIAIDASGNAYVTGDIFQSPDFPTTAGAFDPTLTNGDHEAFVTKLDPAGNVVYSTFLGGTGLLIEQGRSIAVDSLGCAYVMGVTGSSDFPTTPGAFNTTLGAGIFVTKLNPSGTGLVYSTFLGESGGGVGGSFGHYIVVDAAGSVYVTGGAGSSNFPTTPGAFDRTGQSGSGFVAKLNPSGTALEYSTFLTGTGHFNSPLALAVDSSGSAYVTGITDSTDFPITPGAFDASRNGNGPVDSFVAKLNPTGSALEYSTYLGGEFEDQANAIAIDSRGSAYVVGSTRSRDFPTNTCALSRTRGGATDAFVTKLNPTGTALEYSTYLGGSQNIPLPSGGVIITGEIAYGIVVDSSGNALVTGLASSPDFPTTPDAIDRSVSAVDVFVTRLSASGGFITYSTFLGGSDNDQALGVALDGLGTVYLSGSTSSPDFPTTSGAFDVTYNPGNLPFQTTDAFVTRLTLPPHAPELSSIPITIQVTPASAESTAGTSATLTAAVGNTLSNPLPNVVVRFNVTGSRLISGSCITGVDGRCDFIYQGPAFNGSDSISSFVDSDNDNIKDVCEPSVTTTNTWVGNAPPTVNNPGLQRNFEGDAVSLQIVASDVDGDTLTYSATGLPAGLAIDPGTGIISGTIDFNAGGFLDEDDIFRPERAYSVTVTVSDGLGTRGVSFNWGVTDVPGGPAAQSVSAATAEDLSTQITLAASDPNGDSLTYEITANPLHGTVTVTNGIATYTPALNYSGLDTFSFRASDGTFDSNIATVSITVTAVNDAPIAFDGAISLNEDTPIEITLLATDVDSSALTFAVATQTIHGTLSFIGNNKLLYSPDPSFNGVDVFTFLVNDGASDSNLATYAINVSPVADVPVLANVGNQVVAEGALLSFNLSATDPDGEQLTFGASGLPAGATLDPTTGVFTWMPNNDQAGVYTVTFRVTDSTGRSASETITIAVSDVQTNLGPVCSEAYPSVSEIWPADHHQESINILGVTDADNDPITIIIRKILQDEPTNTLGDGNIAIDGGGIGTSQAWVRAERSGPRKTPGNGRIYEIFFEASDGRGKSCTGSIKVSVPHDQGRGPAVDDGKRYDSTVVNGPCLNCIP